MTLITRIIRENDVIIAADNQLNSDSGYPKTHEPKLIQKAVAFFNQKSGCGVSGFIGNDKYSVIEHLKRISCNSSSSNISQLAEEITGQFNAEDIPIDEIVILASGFLDGTQQSFALVKEKGQNGIEIIDNKHPSPIFHGGHAYAICDHFGYNYREIKEIFDSGNHYLDKVDFNFNYSSKVVSEDVHPSIPYTYLYLFLYKRYGEADPEMMDRLDDDEIKEILIDYYQFLEYVNTEIHDKEHKKRNRMLRTIGECGGIIKVAEGTSKWLYRYDDE